MLCQLSYETNWQLVILLFDNKHIGDGCKIIIIIIIISLAMMITCEIHVVEHMDQNSLICIVCVGLFSERSNQKDLKNLGLNRTHTFQASLIK